MCLVMTKNDLTVIKKKGDQQVAPTKKFRKGQTADRRVPPLCHSRCAMELDLSIS